MQTWPTLLVDVGLQFEADPVPNLAVTQYNAPLNQRNRFARISQIHSVRWQFKEFDYALFQSFVRYKLHNGADKFLIELPFGNGLEEVVACFVDGTYRAQYQDPHWVVMASLEIETPEIAAP